LACCKPIANFARGVIPCRFLLKAKAMTYVILVLTWTMPCWVQLIFVY
jgi:hypothetical protein